MCPVVGRQCANVFMVYNYFCSHLFFRQVIFFFRFKLEVSSPPLPLRCLAVAPLRYMFCFNWQLMADAGSRRLPTTEDRVRPPRPVHVRSVLTFRNLASYI